MYSLNTCHIVSYNHLVARMKIILCAQEEKYNIFKDFRASVEVGLMIRDQKINHTHLSVVIKHDHI